MDERTQAISFANNYFALVDGLASGLENHLAEDVVLDWFGRTVRGRRHVTDFMQAHKVNSRHMFTDILPTDRIGYKKRQANRKKLLSRQNRIERESPRNDNEKDVDRTNSEPCFRETDKSSRDVMIDHNQNEIDPKVLAVTDMSYDLSEGDLSNLFKLEIASTNVEEIEQRINRIKLEEEMAPTVRAVKRECGQGDGPMVVDTSTVKYVEANGAIEFSRKFWKQDAWNAYITATSNGHCWTRPCKLQIAYSNLSEAVALEQPRKMKNVATRFGQPKARLPSLEEISEISNRLVPNPSDFGGFLRNIDFFEDRKDFLENLGIEMATKDPCTPLIVPRYVENKLVFNRPSIDEESGKGRRKNKFVFNYKIHVIIYEGSNKCKVNLLDDFENSKI